MIGRKTVVAVAMLLVVSATVPILGFTGVTAASSTISVEAGTDNVDNDGNSGIAETTDGDAVYGSLDAAVDNASTGARVEVAPGTYAGNASISVSGLTVVALGEVILDGTDYTKTGIYVSSTADNVVIDGFTLRRYNHGIQVRGSNATLQGLEIRETYEEGVHIWGDTPLVRQTHLENTGQYHSDEGWDSESSLVIASETSARLESVTVSSAGSLHGAEITGTETVTVIDSRFEDSDADGLQIANAKSVTVRNTTFFNNWEDGLHVHGTDTFGRDVSLENITVRLNSDFGVRIDGTAGDDTAAVLNSTFTANGEYASDEGWSSESALKITDVETVTVTDLSVEDSEENGVQIQSADTATVRNLSVQGSGDDGLELWNVKTVTVRNVTTLNNGYRGITIGGNDDTSRTANVTDVTARLNKYQGVFIEGTSGTDSVIAEDILVKKNGQKQYDDYSGLRVNAVEDFEAVNVTSVSNTLGGVYVSGGSKPSVVLNDVRTEQNGGDGVAIEGAKQITIRNSSISGSGSEGIAIWDTSLLGRSVTISNVTVELAGGNGIYVQGTTGDDTFTATDLVVNSSGEVTDWEDPQEGVYLELFESVSIDGFTASGNFEDGLYLAETGSVSIQNATLTDNDGAGLEVGSAADAGSTAIHNSTIANNAGLGINNLASGVVNATNNYWGAADGPSSADDSDAPFEDPVTGTLADGSGDGVSEGSTSGVANVHFDPHKGSVSTSSGGSSVLATIAGSDGVVSTSDLRTAIQHWVMKTTVSGTNGKTITTTTLREIIQAWVMQTPV